MSNAPGKRGRMDGDDLRTVVDAMLYLAQTGCRWRYLPASFGPWTRVWSPFRRWSCNGTWAQALTVLHAVVRREDGRAEVTPSMVVIDTHLARGASNGDFTFQDRGPSRVRSGIARNAAEACVFERTLRGISGRIGLRRHGLAKHVDGFRCHANTGVKFPATA